MGLGRQLLCFYFVFTVSATVGFGDISTVNTAERVNPPPLPPLPPLIHPSDPTAALNIPPVRSDSSLPSESLPSFAYMAAARLFVS